MTIIIRKIKKIFNNSGKGFVILFAVVVSSILLAITLGVANIALKELKFTTSARDTNEAFFAADTGTECALMNDKPPSTTFAPSGGSGTAVCLSGGTLVVTGNFASGWNFVVPGLGSRGVSCAKVNVLKANFVGPDGVTYISTTVTSKGYNIGDASCNSTNPDRIERQVETRY